MRGASQPATTAEFRRPGLDTLRAGATVLVVLLHAAIPYATTPMPGLAWPVRHPAPSDVVEVVFWGIACGIMPVFFWLSGYGASQSLLERGPRDFWRGRWRRIGIPLVACSVVLLPFEFYIWLTGWALDGQIPWVKLRSLKLGPYHEGLWGLSHLWYLEYLLVLCALLIAWDAIVTRTSELRIRRVRPTGIVMTVALAASAVLWWSPETLVGFQHSFFPVPAKFALSAVFFAAGVATQRSGRIVAGQGYGALVACSLVLTAVYPLLVEQAGGGTIGLDRFVLALGLGAYAALFASGLWNLFAGQRRKPGRAVRFAASASYWTYLVHHPVIAILHIVLRPTGWPALVQFALTATVTLSACWSSYALVDRMAKQHTDSGRNLNQSMLTEPARLRRAA